MGGKPGLYGADASERRFQVGSGEYSVLHLALTGWLTTLAPDVFRLQHSRATQRYRASKAGDVGDRALEIEGRPGGAVSLRIGAGTSWRWEGHHRLNWALLLAGARAAVVTLWPVDSASTTELVRAFHEEALKPDVSKARALQASELQLLRGARYRHPFYWALLSLSETVIGHIPETWLESYVL